MNRDIPYSKEEIADPNLDLDADVWFGSWGYSNEDIKRLRIWQQKRRY